ncbi:hypothetical protein [Ruegeria arenilitoris]|uniref:hypothetical protein n=1 Tax=Ruegeria arenilitoris TaxID=1173585 RepID=UPI001582DF0A|nr:hypothetical protein [Ruegeria arenilitoris]
MHEEPTCFARCWRLAGEICDGKCLASAMRPGRGIAHKACANLRLIGDIPPVFVSTKPVDGSEFLMVVDQDGGPLPGTAYDYFTRYISLEGEVVRHGDLLVLRIDAGTTEVVKGCAGPSGWPVGNTGASPAG